MGLPHFELCVQTHFSAAHHLVGYEGNCAQPHGHNWSVQVHVSCRKLNAVGIAIDFRELKASISNVIQELDHADLNTLPAFADLNPSSELIAQYIYRTVASRMNGLDVRITKVVLGETPSYSVTYSERGSE
jgi:6-pyruvoyltetrahydropterin/6-carboxytetrahydropterin synthase